ncbi:MAG: lysophospholipid acyltransferase family protein [Gemmatimonadetes bacterium]|nr:lysophospholipid acyltransferase family protein [Gemmatimonadota bacterium]
MTSDSGAVVRDTAPTEGASPPERRLDWRRRLAVAVGWVGLRLLGATWRVTVHGREWLLARPDDAPRVVLMLWHGQLLPLLWVHRQRTGVIISEHADGEVIARVVASFGFFPVRGSSSRGGARALLEAARALVAGSDIAITPDGPRGPRHSFAPGALMLAHRTGAALVPLVAHADRVWRLPSWDQFEIPKPFARVTVLYDAPISPEEAPLRTVVEKAPAFSRHLEAAAERVRRLAITDR